MRVSLEQAIAELKNGGVVAIPTETVYGLAADATNDSALKQIFAIKQRPADHPLIVHIGAMSQVQDWATVFPEVARDLASAFWPGPLTLVLPAQPHVSRVVRGDEPTVALRVPNHPVALALLTQGGLSVAAPSANLFTQLSPTTAAHVEAGLGASISVLDGGACQVGIESTIVSVTADGQWQLLRPGMISEQAIADVAARAASQPTQAVESVDAPVPKVPGQHALHYSPRTPLLLFKDRAALLQECELLKQAALSSAAMLIGDGTVPSCPYVQLPNSPEKVAELLYGALHHLDAMKVDRLLVELPPNLPIWMAVLDRLSRAGYR
ncbi:L-threonylcarbamoyladenylate synthase [Methylotenera mobilis]|uniref:Threonylcarbamoyl-AMP synthase n=1 Tax=Methylotenera mobilis (strain JLW8 / ATCC BAA-1282 / DSM 17540) TaxID=583345 RepID=C6WYS4_METML|nr:L-threonylcarbamoyladenylate synthase [Methylotenera mobilis]ACT47049.1 Sua5/YciO/YrdC/YwlC family protein [Methylotenera mobilis JLW8]